MKISIKIIQRIQWHLKHFNLNLHINFHNILTKYKKQNMCTIKFAVLSFIFLYKIAFILMEIPIHDTQK